MDITTTGPVGIDKNAGDPEVLVNVYGSYTGFAFSFEWSPDGTNGWAPLAVMDLSTGSIVSGSLTPANGASRGWRVPCDDIHVRMNVSAITGTVTASFKSSSKASQMPVIIAQAVSPEGLPVVNAAVTTDGAETLGGDDIVGGVITRSGSSAAFTDTTDTAVNIIAEIATPVTGMTWELTIKNTTNFVQTLVGGVDVTLSGQDKIPANCTARFLCTVTGATTVSIQCLMVTENNPIPNAKFTSINATTGSLAAGVATGARNVYILSTNATPGAQLVRSAANMLADIPNGVVGMSWRLFITNSGAGTLTLTTDAGATVTMTGTMTVPRNTTREFIVTITGATTATVQSVDPLKYPATEVVTALSTAGAGTITAAGIVGGVTNRTGPTDDFIDTTDTGTAINAALLNSSVGQSWEWTYINTTNFTATLANGAGVTTTGLTIPPTTWARYLATLTASNTVTLVQIEHGSLTFLPVVATPVAATGAGGGVAGAAALSAAKRVLVSSDGATKGVKFATTGAGEFRTVINTSATACNLFAASGGTINGGVADAGVTIPASKGVIAFTTALDTWWVFDLTARAGAAA